MRDQINYEFITNTVSELANHYNLEELHITKLPSMSNKTYLVKSNDKYDKYIVKVIEETHLLTSVRDLVKKSNSMMELLNYDMDYMSVLDSRRSIVIKRYDNNPVFTPDTDDSYYSVVLKELKRLHSIDTSKIYDTMKIKEFNFFDYSKKYMTALLDIDYEKYIKIISDDYEVFKNYHNLAKGHDLVLSHCDLTESNIIYNLVKDTAEFIDFEYSGLAPKEFDLSTLIMYSDSSDVCDYINKYYGKDYDEDLIRASLQAQARLWIEWSYFYAENIVNNHHDYVYLTETYINYLKYISGMIQR